MGGYDLAWISVGMTYSPLLFYVLMISVYPIFDFQLFFSFVFLALFGVLFTAIILRKQREEDFPLGKHDMVLKFGIDTEGYPCVGLFNSDLELIHTTFDKTIEGALVSMFQYIEEVLEEDEDEIEENV